MKKRVLSAMLICNVVILSGFVEAETMKGDVFITPYENPGYFGGYAGGDGSETGNQNLDWSIGNTVPFAPVTNDMVFSTCSGDYSVAESWHEAMRITKNGNVGIGTALPGYKLHITDESNQASAMRITLSSIGSDWLQFEMTGYNPPRLWSFFSQNGNFNIRDGHNDVIRLTIDDNDGNIGIGTTSPEYPLQMGSGAHVTAGGVWTNASSKEYKENIKEFSAKEAVETLKELTPVKYNYKNEKDEEYVGFIAEDVPDTVAMKDRKSLNPMDMVAMLTKVVQVQQDLMEKQQETIDQLAHKIEALEK